MKGVQLACGEVAALLRAAPEPAGWLSGQEQARFATLRTDKRRQQFIAARWQARCLLGKVFGGGPQGWELTAPPDAPPGVAARPDLHLSISHSGAFTACALSAEPVGLDLEAPQRARDIEGLIALACTPREQALFAGADREDLFYELWTVKEAWLKRRREWIAPSRLQQIECVPGEGEVRTWKADGWRLAMFSAEQEVRWWTQEPGVSRRWRITA